MSGPVSAADVEAVGAVERVSPDTIEITLSRETQVGAVRVRRALPRRTRRTIGPWCFVDHMGPLAITADRQADIAPHPHMGLQTVTWLLAGELVHRDSLGSEEIIRPGQLNLMTAGHGVAHSEEGTGTYRGELQGVQLWVALPASTRDGPAAFEHHRDLPRVELESAATATVLVGEVSGATSAARRDSEQVGVDLDLRAGPSVVPLRPDFEHGLVVLTGSVAIEGHVVEPGHLAYLSPGRDELPLVVKEPSRAVLLGGRPFGEPVLMWWNFVARTRDEIDAAYAAWAAGDERFGAVRSKLPRTGVDAPPWLRPAG